jgi:hypothetical protein
MRLNPDTVVPFLPLEGRPDLCRNSFRKQKQTAQKNDCLSLRLCHAHVSIHQSAFVFLK